MEDFSQLSRCGLLQGEVKSGTLSNDQTVTKVPFLAFTIQSKISIGFGETVEESTNVLLCGQAVECWNNLPNPPKEGDRIILQGATAYVNGGTLCCRVQMPGQFIVIPAGTNELHYGTKVSADDFFLKFWQQQKEQQGKT